MELNILGDIYKNEAIRLYDDLTDLYSFEKQSDCLVFYEGYWKDEIRQVCHSDIDD